MGNHSINELLDSDRDAFDPSKPITPEAARAALEAHHSAFSLNEKLLEPGRHGLPSHAVRFNSAVKTLVQNGYRIEQLQNRAFDRDKPAEPRTLRVSGQLPRGNFSGLSVYLPDSPLEQKLMEAAFLQAVFYDNSLKLAVTHDCHLANPSLGQSHLTLGQVYLIELGLSPLSKLTPESAYAWIAEGGPWRPELVSEWSEHFSMQAALEWAPHPLRPDELLDASTVLEWAAGQHSKSEMDEWIKANSLLADHCTALRWMHAGFTPEQAAVWIDNNILSAHRASAYRDRNIRAEDSILYQRVGGIPVVKHLTLDQVKQILDPDRTRRLSGNTQARLRRWLNDASHSKAAGGCHPSAQDVVDLLVKNPYLFNRFTLRELEAGGHEFKDLLALHPGISTKKEALEALLLAKRDKAL